MSAAVKTTPAWRVLLAMAAVHACNDAFFYVLYPLLPFMAADLRLSYAEVGVVNATFAGSGAVLQLPAGMLGERFGEYALVAWGNGWVGAGLVGMAAAGTFPVLLGASLIAGLGGNLQHPLAASLVARAYDGRNRGAAIGTLNFAGDLGKLAAPALVTVVTLTVGWRLTLVALGIAGVAFSVGIRMAQRWVHPPRSDDRAQLDTGARRRFGLPRPYWILSVVGMLDATTRTAALTFLPFLLGGRGLSPMQVGLLLGALFAGGSAGKFLCGRLGDRFGAFAVVLLTEALTALALIGLAWGPVEAALACAVVFGFGLNGTSSVLYAAVASLVPDGSRGRGYGLYYTATQSAGAVAALGYGLVADNLGLDWTFGLMALLTFTVIPVAAPIRRQLSA